MSSDHSDKGSGLINSKYMNVLAVVLIAAALIFVTLMLVAPNLIPIQSAASAVNYDEMMFNRCEITTIEIEMGEKDWDYLLSNPSDKNYMPCNVTINGQKFNAVGIRVKGYSSLVSVEASNSDRYSFRFKADEYITGQTFFGLTDFVVNNQYRDPTYMKEYLAYDAMDSMGVPTPLFAYADIDINGKDWGLYLAVEAVEDDFAKRVFGNDYGHLYKPEKFDKVNSPKDNGYMPPPDADLNQGASLIYTTDSIWDYWQLFGNVVFSDTSKSDFQRVITAIKHVNEGDDLENYVFVNETLAFFAVNGIIVNMDTYTGPTLQNYYLYENDGKILIFPWDMNFAFDGYKDNSTPSVVDYPIDTPIFSNVSMYHRPLLNMMLKNETYKEQYYSYIDTFNEEYFKNGRYEETINSVDEMIGDSVRDDPTAFVSYERYAAGVEALRVFGQYRSRSLDGQLNGTIPKTHFDQRVDQTNLSKDAPVDAMFMERTFVYDIKPENPRYSVIIQKHPPSTLPENMNEPGVSSDPDALPSENPRNEGENGNEGEIENENQTRVDI
ncbi:CotH kinase family protein [Methanimicrococcus blatticola]|uniref:CotH protein n=1 Tax=Methanimicrococcus blatticola TaxID=91560 RepID=A0A484F483_9EURY|nr:CotH kinase family protein [Methanimicrococcus blatticola]MBZ3935612.1 CotH kinase family protein [Methanimicrococcus blatticola]MCC2509253.1 CotH kinase family protein [Methanimicrococcus blatticola]TDQ69381.1 CotH protein [Methanimicrococcus blatticola]